MKHSRLLQYLLVSVLVCSAMSLHAQNCPDFPVDCPDNETLQQLADKKWEGPSDLKVKEEYAMQDSLRRFIHNLVTQIASKRNWRVYEFMEEQESGIGIDDNTKPLPYNLRRPCQWHISFIFIVNEDSLHAWQNWYNTELQSRYNGAVDSYKQAGTSQTQMENAGAKLKKLEEYQRINTIAFRNSSMIRVSFAFNDYTTYSMAENVKPLKQLSLPGSSLGLVMHNSEPYEKEIFGQYTRVPDFAMVLFGKWVTKMNQYRCFDAALRTDPKNLDGKTAKRIPCDKVQTISLTVEGSTSRINQFIQSLDTQKIGSLVVKE